MLNGGVSDLPPACVRWVTPSVIITNIIQIYRTYEHGDNMLGNNPVVCPAACVPQSLMQYAMIFMHLIFDGIKYFMCTHVL